MFGADEDGYTVSSSLPCYKPPGGEHRCGRGTATLRDQIRFPALLCTHWEKPGTLLYFPRAQFPVLRTAWRWRAGPVLSLLVGVTYRKAGRTGWA